MQLNGNPLDAERFIERIQQNMDHAVEVEARKIVSEVTNLDQIEEVFAGIRKDIQRKLRRQLLDVGMDISEEDDAR
jgi:hypothetical protein